jgi:hypothetical protein
MYANSAGLVAASFEDFRLTILEAWKLVRLTSGCPWEPYDGRLSRTVLRELGGLPPATQLKGGWGNRAATRLLRS